MRRSLISICGSQAVKIVVRRECDDIGGSTEHVLASSVVCPRSFRYLRRDVSNRTTNTRVAAAFIGNIGRPSEKDIACCRRADGVCPVHPSSRCSENCVRLSTRCANCVCVSARLSSAITSSQFAVLLQAENALLFHSNVA